MRKVFNCLSIFCIVCAVLLSLMWLGTDHEFKYSSVIAAIFFGALGSALFWALGLFVETLLQRIHL